LPGLLKFRIIRNSIRNIRTCQWPLKPSVSKMRLETTMIERVDAWRRKQEDLPSRAEAFRRLIEVGLSAKKTGPKVKT
jgi:hypothetical protein